LIDLIKMRELDFDLGLSQDAARALYRAGVIFRVIIGFRRV
jgi:hypothetical protein